MVDTIVMAVVAVTGIRRQAQWLKPSDIADITRDTCRYPNTDAGQLSPPAYNLAMADVSLAVPEVVTDERTARHTVARTKLRKNDLWIALTALTASMLALPLAQNNWHGPEVAATLAVAATAMLAGQRWAIALVVLSEMLLAPTIIPRMLSHAGLFANITGLLAVMAIVPGLLAMRRAASAMVLLTGWKRTQRSVRRANVALVACAVLVALIPFF